MSSLIWQAVPFFLTYGGHLMATQIELRGISTAFDGQKVLDKLDLTIVEDEFLTLLGPSGCGKTTTLRIIAGFTQPDEGEVLFYDKNILSLAPYERPFNTVFQRYALFPHLNVYDNIAFGLKLKKLDSNTINKKVNEMLELVGLNGFGKRQPSTLSGGQQQRVAIARALINEPEVLLLDEPLAALDLRLRKDMQIELKRIQKIAGITFVYVTHDQEEALTMSDRVVVMNNGKIQQIGSPIDIYNEPINRFVARFIGESNIIEGTMLKDYLVNFLGVDFPCVDAGFQTNEAVDIVIRPEDLEISNIPANGQLQGKVISSLFKGVHYELMIKVDNYTFKAHNTLNFEVGKQVGLSIEPSNLQIMHRSEDDPSLLGRDWTGLSAQTLEVEN